MILNKIHIKDKVKIFLLGNLLILLAFACEDIYHPALMDTANLPVIEARITNDPAFNYIILSTTNKFTDDLTFHPISKAQIEVMKEDGTFYQAEHTYSGHYNFNHTLEPGKQYKLRIKMNNEVYESNWEKMPPLPTIEKFYVEPYIRVIYAENLYGIPEKRYTKGFQVSVDIPVTNDNQNYMFRWQSFIQFVIPYKSYRSYEWVSFFKYASDNMAVPSLHSSSSIISKHPLMFHTLDYISYIDTGQYSMRKKAFDFGWIFEIDQYGLSDGACQFYKDAIKQLKAEGQLFDPMNSQIHGNISCATNPDQQIFGVFDLSSVQRYQYYVTNIEGINIYYHKIEPIIDFPDEGVSDGAPPEFWQRKK